MWQGAGAECRLLRELRHPNATRTEAGSCRPPGGDSVLRHGGCSPGRLHMDLLRPEVMSLAIRARMVISRAGDRAIRARMVVFSDLRRWKNAQPISPGVRPARVVRSRWNR